MNTSPKPILIIGATGVIGSRVVNQLQQMHPDAPLVLASNDLTKSQQFADTLQNARAVSVDLSRADLGLSKEEQFSVVAIFLKDNSLNSLKFAQANNAAYMDISSAVFEIGPEVAQFTETPSNILLLNSNWLAGTSTAITLGNIEEFSDIDSITVSALLDEQDMGGKAADMDYERQTGAVTSALVLADGQWRWFPSKETSSSFESVDGRTMQSQLFSNQDVLSLAAATGAKTVTFEFAVGETAARRIGKHFSHEITIVIKGTKEDAKYVRRISVVHPAGQAPMTALSAAIAIEQLANLANQSPLDPGIYLSHKVIDPSYAVKRLKEIGTDIQTTDTLLQGEIPR